MRLRDSQDETYVLPHRGDLRAVADDAGVHGELVPELVGLERQQRRFEAEESVLEAGPFGFDHAPGEAGREHPLGHFGEHAIVAKLAQRLGIWRGRHQLGERFRPAFALLRSGADGLKRSQGPGTPVRKSR
jgi:hypothetical protein